MAYPNTQVFNLIDVPRTRFVPYSGRKDGGGGRRGRSEGGASVGPNDVSDL